ncbi:MAG TPA: nuclear transport factor 2 family protein [Tepidisphaeraceae bacterium]|nr:nuclear transport factor 2 family protein [Tepidisphaeraceae bacterium]
MKAIARSAIKSVDIQAPFERAFGFLANPMNWPLYAVVNLRSVRPGNDGWFKIVSKFGEGEIKLSPVKELGICDHQWRDPQASWTVPLRVVPNGGGVTVTMTLFQPPVMTDRQFDQAMGDMDIEMAKLREVLESSAEFEPLPPAQPASIGVQIVQDLYAAFAHRDFPKIFSLLSPDVEITQSTELPWGGRYRGHEEAKQFFAQLGAHLNSTLALERFVSSGDSVLATGWTEGKVVANGAHFRVAIVHLWRIQDGRIVRAQFMIDHPAMFAALRAAK